MTPEQIKQLLADAKKMDLSSGLTEMLRQRTSAPGWKTQVQQQASHEALQQQARQGLTPTLGPMDLMTPALRMAAAAPAAVGIGGELGHAVKQGYVSNENFDNVALGAVGLLGTPLLGPKGTGKLYSKALQKAIDDQVDLLNKPLKWREKWYADNSVPAPERKWIEDGLKNFRTREHPADLNQLYFLQRGKQVYGRRDVDSSFAEDFRDVSDWDDLAAAAKKLDTLDPFQPYANYHNVTFPPIKDKLHLKNPATYSNVLMHPDTQPNSAGLPINRNHWNSIDEDILFEVRRDLNNNYNYNVPGSIHTRLAFSQEPQANVGIIGEVQSDLWKKLSPEARKADVFLADYENLATRQGLLELLQHNANIAPEVDLRLVTPSGKLQQQVNHNNTSNLYNTIYDKRVPSAIEKATGYKLNPTALEYPHTPIAYVNNNDVKELQKQLDEVVRIGDDEAKQREFYSTFDPPTQKGYRPVNVSQNELLDLKEKTHELLDKFLGGSKASREKHGQFYTENIRDLLYLIIYEGLEKKYFLDKAANYKPPPVFNNLWETTIPAADVRRLAKEGLPLWMLPIGAGIYAQEMYNNNRTSANANQ